MPKTKASIDHDSIEEAPRSRSRWIELERKELASTSVLGNSNKTAADPSTDSNRNSNLKSNLNVLPRPNLKKGKSESISLGHRESNGNHDYSDNDDGGPGGFQSKLSKKAQKREQQRQILKEKKEASKRKKEDEKNHKGESRDAKRRRIDDSEMDIMIQQCIGNITTNHNANGSSDKSKKSSSNNSNTKSKYSKLNPNPELSLHYISQSCDKIVADPEREFSKSFPFLLRLHEVLEDGKIKHCALISAIAVIKDILPSYRVRNDSQDASTEKMDFRLKKQTLMLQKYETNLLKEYENLLSKLTIQLRTNPQIYTQPLCQLVTNGSAVQFNHRGRLLTMLVKLAVLGGHRYEHDDDQTQSQSQNLTVTNTNTSNFTMIVQPSINALKEVIEQDVGLEACKEIVQNVAALAKRSVATKKNNSEISNNSNSNTNTTVTVTNTVTTNQNVNKFHLNHHLLDVLLHLRLDRSADIKVKNGDEDERELDKNKDDEDPEGENEALKRELMEGKISVKRANALRKLELEILTEVIVIYLRILRTKHYHSVKVLKSTLQGLAKFSLLVNLELLVEILEEVRIIVEEAINNNNNSNKAAAAGTAAESSESGSSDSSNAFDPSLALLGITCAFRLLASPEGRTLECDVSWLSTTLIDVIPLFLLDTSSESQTMISSYTNSCTSSDSNSLHLLIDCLRLSQECPQVFSKSSLGPLAELCEVLFSSLNHISNVSDSLNGNSISNSNITTWTSASSSDVLEAGAKIFRRYYRLQSLLHPEGAIFHGSTNSNSISFGCVTDRPISVFWQVLALTHHYNNGRCNELGRSLLQGKNLSNNGAIGGRNNMMMMEYQKKQNHQNWNHSNSKGGHGQGLNHESGDINYVDPTNEILTQSLDDSEDRLLLQKLPFPKRQGISNKRKVFGDAKLPSELEDYVDIEIGKLLRHDQKFLKTDN